MKKVICNDEVFMPSKGAYPRRAGNEVWQKNFVTLCLCSLPWYSCNYPAAPHLAAIGPAHVPDVRFAVPLATICGTAEELRFGGGVFISGTSWIVTYSFQITTEPQLSSIIKRHMEICRCIPRTPGVSQAPLPLSGGRFLFS